MQRPHWTIGLISIMIAISNMAFTHDAATLRRGERETNRQGDASLSTSLMPAPAPNPPPGPDRSTIITVEYTEYKWYMVWWKGNNIVCTVISDHNDNPLPDEIYRDCGEKVYTKWMTQPSCNSVDKNNCDGYYTYLKNGTKKEKEIAMQLPPASVWISLEDCEPILSKSTNICETNPILVITGIEPLPNESIIRIEGTYDGKPFSCADTDVCKIHIPSTDEGGVAVEFWSYSSYGDGSEVYSAQVRVQQTEAGDTDQLYWYVDVLSSQWQGQAVASCSDSWGVFPPVGGVPEWLSTPKQSEALSSDIPYTYLAANLILQGAVDASACPNGGLAANNFVNQCGLEKSRNAVNKWQDQFDELILNTAKDTGVPARLIKNLFARESQFWPGIYQGIGDAGLGQLTENGADTTLFWNPSFFYQFCPIVMDASLCGRGYMHLDEESQITLRRALVGSVNATCEDCPLGLDLTQADFSVDVFAHTMLANCEQAGQIVNNYTGESAGEVASYEDLWKFTLANYNAGGGCLAEAITHVQGLGTDLTWDNISPFLTGACSGAIDYVNDISN